MRVICLLVPLVFGSLAVMSCGGGGSIAASDYNPGYGPFDKNGNYVEAWADRPAKKHWWARSGSKPASTTKPADKSTAIAKNTAGARPPGAVSTTSGRSTPYTSSSSSTQVVSNPPPRSGYKPKTASKPKSTYTPPKPKPKPKPVKPKKPSPIRHVVKKGDTLYGLSRKHGTSVSAIQRANGLSGTTIITGKTILIPR